MGGSAIVDSAFRMATSVMAMKTVETSVMNAIAEVIIILYNRDVIGGK